MLYDEIVSPKYLLRRFYITLCNVIPESDISPCYQFSLFTDPAETEQKQKKREQEKKIQQAMLDIKEKYGKNAILKGVSLEEGATAMQRNRQIGGHRA